MLRFGAEVTCSGRFFQTSAPETGTARLPIKERVLGSMTRPDDAEHKPGVQPGTVGQNYVDMMKASH